MGFALFAVALLAGAEYTNTALLVDEVERHRLYVDPDGMGSWKPKLVRRPGWYGNPESETSLTEAGRPYCYRSLGACKCHGCEPSAGGSDKPCTARPVLKDRRVVLDCVFSDDYMLAPEHLSRFAVEHATQAEETAESLAQECTGTVAATIALHFEEVGGCRDLQNSMTIQSLLMSISNN